LADEWEEGLGPYKPVIRDGRLYGRGSADDGYAVFSAVSAIMAVQKQGVSHPRICVVIEACEESGSLDLPFYMKKLYPSLGNVGLIICLDSGCGNYEQFWLTTSLRGIADGVLRVRMLREGVHSGDASGVVPSTFRVIRQLLDRLEDSQTGEVKLPEAYTQIPEKRIQQAKDAAKFLGDSTWNKFPFVEGAQPLTKDHAQLEINRTWKPQLAYVGATGFPTCQAAGNVLRAETALKLSLRLPPTVNAAVAENAMKKLLETNPPYGAKVTFECGGDPAHGWESPILADWLEKSIDTASNSYFKKPAVQMG
jgi:acetylornithine deacetylase/succinyl-diaminopimelate desuccinylase-like protein